MMELSGIKASLIREGRKYLYENGRESKAIDEFLDGAKKFQIKGNLLIVKNEAKTGLPTLVKAKASAGGEPLRQLFTNQLDKFIQTIASGVQLRMKVGHYLYAKCLKGTSFQTIAEFKAEATFDQTIDAFNRILKVVHKLSIPAAH